MNSLKKKKLLCHLHTVGHQNHPPVQKTEQRPVLNIKGGGILRPTVISDGVNSVKDTDKSGSRNNTGTLNTPCDTEKHKLLMKWKAACGNNVSTLISGGKTTN